MVRRCEIEEGAYRCFGREIAVFFCQEVLVCVAQ